MFEAIITQRLILRAFEPRDAAAFAAYRSDPEVARYQSWEAPYSLEQAVQFVQDMSAVQPGTPGEWFQAAAELRGGELIGDCAFQILREDPRQAEIGVTLARAYQGQGYAREMITALLEHLFMERSLHRVRANIDPRNRIGCDLQQRPLAERGRAFCDWLARAESRLGAAFTLTSVAFMIAAVLWLGIPETEGRKLQ